MILAGSSLRSDPPLVVLFGAWVAQRGSVFLFHGSPVSRFQHRICQAIPHARTTLPPRPVDELADLGPCENVVDATSDIMSSG